MRAIEIAQATTVPNVPPLTKDYLLFVLSASLDFLSKKIDLRSRGDLASEVKMIESQGYSLSLQSMSALVYREFQSPKPISEIFENWNRSDKKYAKRQLTFFKKFFPDDTWVEVDKPGWKARVIRLVSSWYT